MERVSSLGNEAKNPSFVQNTKTTKGKSYSFILICILLACSMAIMSNNLWEKVTCYYSISICDDACNMEKVSTLGDEARNPSLVQNKKLTKGKME